MSSRSESLELTPEPRSVRDARRFVTTTLRRWGLDEAVDTAVLLASELATNAVRHAQTPYAVVVTRTAEGAEIDVLDAGAAPPQPRGHDLDADSGRGLQLVEALADAWGATPADALRGYTKGIRFVLHAAAPAGAADGREALAGA